ncbi:hypothetical protein N7532_009978 [Penicillium argentinense]|uniref:Zn(2)-C6 fungal-type domain-containing protein n=1 Tax=Penicillium argentinense TaxID=1131581 RepID=A0A9W9ENS2_9EURO|nr:uncharacterized protein N7532_009978 [Penicillium argentinense]KAJ5085207.1 hypothetical protein N7532_009978 [Penicillium argentinense]
MEPRRASRACDPCKRRKVRCNGQSRCQQCTHVGLPCTYATGPVQRSRKKTVRRGTVIAECRQGSQARNDHNPGRFLQPWSASIEFPIQSSHPNPAFFLEFLDEYTEYVYPMSPVVPATEIRNLIAQMNENREAASFAYIFIAVTINLTRSEPVQQAPATRERIATFVTRSLEYRVPVGLSTQPNVIGVMENLFTQMCFVGLRRLDLGFSYLRQAISYVYMTLPTHSDEGLAALDVAERSRRQRAYYECFIHERFTALTFHRPTCLACLQNFPDHDPSLPEHVEEGFNLLIQSFCFVDRQFLDFALGDRSGVTVEWIQMKQQELDDYDWHQKVSELPELMQADLVITRHWLRTLTWQIALSNTLLSSSSTSLLLSLSFPLRLSSQLRQFLSAVPRDMVGIHGSGILEKLFEIANTITDVVLHLKHAPGDETVERVYDIMFLRDFIYSFPGFETLRPAALTEKFEQIRSKYPGIKEIELLQ